ncbi:ricin-type beta-trefoil lectin domain protein [Microbulbifer sp. 2304DJ12-6]|uniref:ricin-type beta-trefoil lectin domain protein n=1 Tax=Microbulbifer sp. 2304DJ12-6 TaxID=3233340 RepID=UPI0039AFEC87
MKSTLNKVWASMLIILAGVSVLTNANTIEASYALAQGCYAIKAPQTSRYMHPGGGDYRFDAIDVTAASHFYFKPTRLGMYMLRDKTGNFLTTRGPLDIARNAAASEWAQWSVEPAGNGHFRLFSTKFWKDLRYNKGDGGTYLFDLFNLGNRNSENVFELIEQEDCTPFPEAELNAVINPEIPSTGDVNAPVVGFADVHTHLNSNEFMGGKFLHGRPFHPYGIQNALDDGSGIHGPNGGLDIIGNLQDGGNLAARHTTAGWPNFPYWPNHHTQSHQQAYYKWIERVHLAGLKLIVTHMVQNEVLCEVQSVVNPVSWINPNACDDSSSIDLQLRRVYEMQDYIDAQAGGIGKGFFRIVTSAAEARSVIASGKLAVVLGVEVSSVLDCDEGSGCTEAWIDYKLQYLHSRGIRSLFPIHKFDNDLGGPHMQGADEIINIGNMLQTGHLYNIEACPANEPSGRKLPSSFPLLGNVPFIKDIINLLGASPNYDQNIAQHCNRKHLTAMGKYLINRMIDKEMIIEVDHMSAGAFADTMEIVESRGYSGVISGHSNPKLNGALSPLQQRLLNVGGVMFPYNGPSNYNISNINTIHAAVATTPYLAGVGIGTDTNGLAPQAGRSSTADTNPVTYPFISYDGRVIFDRQKTGNRSFDLNNEGLAHYGLLADLVEDMRLNASPETMNAFFNSAEAYLQMWERATPTTNSQYVQIRDKRSGQCLDVPGVDNGVANYAKVQLETCTHNHFDQHWLVDWDTGLIRNRMNHDLCLTHADGNSVNGLRTSIYACSVNHRWILDGDVIRDAVNPSMVLDGFGNTKGATVGMWEFHGGMNQRWAITEVAAASSGYRNLAKEGTATQSDTSHGGSASRAIDGNISGHWGDGSITHTSISAHPSWTLDLGSIKKIENIAIWNRIDCCDERLQDFHVFVSDLPFTGVNISDSQEQLNVREFFLPGPAERLKYVINVGVGRYVRIQLASANEALSLAEVQVFGQ